MTYTPEQVAARFQIKRQQVMRLAASGKWPSLRIGKFTRFTDEHLAAIEKSAEVQTFKSANAHGRKTRRSA